MADRPIIFSAPMVRALLEGRKTQTRRILNPQPTGVQAVWPATGGARGWNLLPESNRCSVDFTPPRYAPGDRLFVREAFTMNPAVRHPDRVKNVIYRADVPSIEPPVGDVLTMDRLLWSSAQALKWKPSIHMPRWASRLTLTITEVRVQRLQEISEADARAEGLETEPSPLGISDYYCFGSIAYCRAVPAFRALWNSLHGPDAWDQNPWVVALTFTVQRGNIDRLAQGASA